jgi:hypothetical protein
MRIIPHVIKGKAESLFHNFSVTETETEIVVSAGTYYENGAVLLNVPTETRFEKPQFEEWMIYEIWLTQNGFKMYFSNTGYISPENPIDRLAWIAIYPPLPTENNIELHTVIFEEA